MTETANSPVKLAVIGLGMASKPHLAALGQLCGTVEVGGLFDQNPEKVAAACNATGFPAYASFEEILADLSIDAALLITPPAAREEPVRALAGAGKHILMEKPVERNLENARKITAIAEDAGVTLGMVLQHRFREGAERLTRLVADGSLGPIHMVRVCVPWWRDQSYYDAPGRGTYAFDGGGVLLTQAIHVLDLMLSLTGPARAVQAMIGTTPLHDMEGEDFANAGVIFENGALGSVLATTAAYPGRAETLEIDAENAAVRLEAGELAVHWRDGRSETVGEVTGTGGGSDPMDFPCDWHRSLIADFAASIRDGRPPRTTAREALKVHELIDAIERSARNGNRVDLEASS